MSYKPFRQFFQAQGIAGAPAPAATAVPEAPRPKLRRVVLSIERRAAGRTVTLVAEVPVEARAFVMAELRRKLGTGGSIVEDKLVVQGDQRAALTEWFESQGARVAGERL